MRQLLGRPLDAGRARHLGREVMKAPAHDLGVQRLIGVRPEHIREEARVELADHEVGVGDGERPATPVAGGPGLAPAGLGADPKRAPSNTRIEPPPAATVWIAIIGARRRTPATSASNVRS